MSLQIKLYTNESENNVIYKDLTDIITVSGNFRGNISLINPVVTFQWDTTTDFSDYADCNYIYISEFKRYYFVTHLGVLEGNIIELTCHVDVLMSFSNAILANKAIIARQENVWNLYLDDGSFKVYNNPDIVTKAFPSGFNTLQYVLAVAGGGSYTPPNE